MSSSNGENCRNARANEISRRGLIELTAAAGATMAFGAASALAQTGIAGGASSGRAADLVLVNGRIHTMDGAGTVTDALAIQAGRFTAIGADAAAMAASAARTVDLGGRTVFPGLIEPHCHIVSVYNRPGYHTILENTSSLADVQKALAERRKDVPTGGWITSLGGFHPNQWADIKVLPTRLQLDQAVADRPVFLFTRFTGPAVTNSLGKHLFDEWDRTPAHPSIVKVAVGDDGFIAAGGFGQVTPASSALFLLRMRTTFEDKLRTTIETQRYAASLGLTSMANRVLSPTPGPLHPIQILSNLDHYRMYDPVLELDRQQDKKKPRDNLPPPHQPHIPARCQARNPPRSARASAKRSPESPERYFLSPASPKRRRPSKFTPPHRAPPSRSRRPAASPRPGSAPRTRGRNAQRGGARSQPRGGLAAEPRHNKRERHNTPHPHGDTAAPPPCKRALGGRLKSGAPLGLLSNQGNPGGALPRNIRHRGKNRPRQANAFKTPPPNPGPTYSTSSASSPPSTSTTMAGGGSAPRRPSSSPPTKFVLPQRRRKARNGQASPQTRPAAPPTLLFRRTGRAATPPPLPAHGDRGADR